MVSAVIRAMSTASMLRRIVAAAAAVMTIAAAGCGRRGATPSTSTTTQPGVSFGPGAPKLGLTPISETEFTAAEIPDVLSFVRDKDGRVTGLLTNVDDLGAKQHR